MKVHVALALLFSLALAVSAAGMQQQTDARERVATVLGFPLPDARSGGGQIVLGYPPAPDNTITLALPLLPAADPLDVTLQQRFGSQSLSWTLVASARFARLTLHWNAGARAFAHSLIAENRQRLVAGLIPVAVDPSWVATMWTPFQTAAGPSALNTALSGSRAQVSFSTQMRSYRVQLRRSCGGGACVWLATSISWMAR